ncbi:MAG: DNA repair protein RadC [Actinomycetota bacterium]|nr:DNA repair protein RadC [Actinomycetota bacterium]
MTVSMAQIAEQDRPRERLDRLGAHSLTDAELVALVLRSGAPGRNALELAHQLLAEHGGLGPLACQGLARFASTHAVGPAKASSLMAAFELGRRVAVAETPSAVRIRDAGDIAALVRRSITDPAREESFVVVLSASHRVLRVEPITKGSESRCLVEVREVLTTVLRGGGSAFALVHTHPSGEASPSAEDLAFTRVLAGAAEAVGLVMLDHIIVSGPKWSTLGELLR